MALSSTAAAVFSLRREHYNSLSLTRGLENTILESKRHRTEKVQLKVGLKVGEWSLRPIQLFLERGQWEHNGEVRERAAARSPAQKGKGQAVPTPGVKWLEGEEGGWLENRAWMQIIRRHK